MKRTDLQFNIDPRLITKVKDGEKRAAYYYLSNQTYLVGAVPSCHIQSCFFDIVLMESFIYRDEIYLYGKDHLDVNEEYNNTLVLYFYGRTQQDWVAQDKDFRCWNILIETDNGNFYLKSDSFLTDAFIQPAAILQNGQSGKQVFVKGFVIDWDILQTISSAKEIKFSVSGISNIPLEPDDGLDYDNFVEGLTFTIDVRAFALHARNFINAISLTEQEDNCLKQREPQININPLLVTKVKNDKRNTVYYLNNQAYPVGAVPSCHIQSCFANLALMKSLGHENEKRCMNEEYKNMPVLYLYGRAQQGWVAWGYSSSLSWELFIETDNGKFYTKSKSLVTDVFIPPAAILQDGQNSKQAFVKGFIIDWDILQAICSAKEVKFTVSGIINTPLDSDGGLDYDNIVKGLTFTIDAGVFAFHARNFINATSNCLKQQDSHININPLLATKVRNNIEKAVYYLSNKAYPIGAIPSCHIQSCFFNLALMESFEYWKDKEELYKNKEYKNMPVLYFYGRMQQDWLAAYCHVEYWDLLIETDKGNFFLRPKWALLDAFILPPAITQGTRDPGQNFIQGYPVDLNILQAISSAGQIKFTIFGITIVRIDSETEEEDLDNSVCVEFTNYAESLSTHARDFLAAISPAEQGAS